MTVGGHVVEEQVTIIILCLLEPSPPLSLSLSLSLSLCLHRAPDPNATDAKIPVQDLPRYIHPTDQCLTVLTAAYWLSLSPSCRCAKCNSLARPHVIWFGEGLDPHVLSAVDDALDQCDLCLLVSDSASTCMRLACSGTRLQGTPEYLIKYVIVTPGSLVVLSM